MLIFIDSFKVDNFVSLSLWAEANGTDICTNHETIYPFKIVFLHLQTN